MARDESFLRITQMQRDIGVEVRMLDHQLIPDWMRSMIFDFIVFDGAVSYETTPTTSFSTGDGPGMLRTRLAPEPARVRDLEERFEKLWEAGRPRAPDRRVSGDAAHAGSVSPGAANTYRIRSTSSSGSSSRRGRPCR